MRRTPLRWKLPHLIVEHDPYAPAFLLAAALQKPHRGGVGAFRSSMRPDMKWTSLEDPRARPFRGCRHQVSVYDVSTLTPTSSTQSVPQVEPTSPEWAADT